ncbi:sigma-70 family RNA polymerase sigma factor [bacterium]|nr:sigma-70 family RNA polymerase sigma factor [bacterium]
MELAQDKIELISKVIKEDRKYSSNEDLYDDFFNETCRRSMSIINAIDSETTLTAYLRRIATTSIINVLKDSGRLKRTKSGYMSTKEVIVENTDNSLDYSRLTVDYSSVKVPQTPEEVVIQKDILQFVADTIKKIDKEDPDKQYLQIYTLRYDKGMTQNEISADLGISQSEISKRLYRLMDKVKSILK